MRGHEAAIRLVDADNFVCLCCPAPLRNNSMFKTGPTVDNVLRHVGTMKHSACAAHWVRMQHLMRRLRLFAQLSCHGTLAPPNAPMLRAAAASMTPRPTSSCMRVVVCECVSVCQVGLLHACGTVLVTRAVCSAIQQERHTAHHTAVWRHTAHTHRHASLPAPYSHTAPYSAVW